MKTLGVSLGFVKIPISHFVTATAFYRDVLGLDEQFAAEQYGWAQYDVGNTVICLYVLGKSNWDSVDGAAVARIGVDTGIQLRVTDAKTAHTAITHRGGRTSKLTTGNDGTVGFSVADPDGNVIAVAQVLPE